MRVPAWSAAVLLALTVSACGEDGGNPCTNCPGPVSTAFEGVLGGNDGAELGTLSLILKDDGTGSGSFKIGGAVTNLTSVAVNTDQLTASGGGYTFTGTVSGIFIDGSYTGGPAGGLLAAAEKVAAIEMIPFCALHDGGTVAGVFAFIYNSSTNSVRGVWTSGLSSSFKGIISGFTGDNLGFMSGHTGTVTIAPDLPGGTVTGFYDLDSGEVGDISGPVCP